jgi:hypothetical protein
LCVPQDRKAHEDAKKSNTEDVKSAEKKKTAKKKK